MAAQRQAPQVLGFFPPSPSSATSTLALSAAATWLAYSFVPDANRQVAKVRAFVSAIGGTLGATDVSCDLYSDNNGVPNASIESRNTLTAALSAGAFGEWTGFTSASNVTGEQQFWLVLKNLNGTPATNFPTFRFLGGNVWPFGIGFGFGWGKIHSTNSGGTWITGLSPSGGFRIEYADGTFQGIPCSNVATAGTGNAVFGSQEVGMQWTTPVSARLNVRGVLAYNRSTTGSPSAGVRGRLYTGASPALLATTPTFDKVSGPSWFPLYFAATQVVEPNTVLTVVMGEDTNGDTNANRYSTSEYTIENDANSKSLLPWGGKEAVWNGSVWTYTDTQLVPIGLILDTDGEFAAQASGAPLSRAFLGMGA